MGNLSRRAAENLEAIRKSRPLIHNITNYVAMNYTANALLAMGASPVMAHCAEEVEEMAAMAGALVLNIGTLSPDWIESMIRAGKKAISLGTPVILDPVGAGATSFRTRSAERIMKACRVSVVRGNPSEILSLGDSDSRTKGVDSLHSVEEASETAAILSRKLKTTLAITGPMDFVTDGTRLLRVRNGHPLMGRVTGTGCTATALIGAFLAVDKDPAAATATALAFFGLAGETAAKKASAPGSFMIALLDALYEITPQRLEDGSRIEET